VTKTLEPILIYQRVLEAKNISRLGSRGRGSMQFHGLPKYSCHLPDARIRSAKRKPWTRLEEGDISRARAIHPRKNGTISSTSALAWGIGLSALSFFPSFGPILTKLHKDRPKAQGRICRLTNFFFGLDLTAVRAKTQGVSGNAGFPTTGASCGILSYSSSRAGSTRPWSFLSLCILAPAMGAMALLLPKQQSPPKDNSAWWTAVDQELASG